MVMKTGMSKANKKKLEKRERNRNDKIWRLSIVEEYRGCAICGKRERANAHHIIPRTFKDTRWDFKNGILLCPKHHKLGKYSAHKHPLWFVTWLANSDWDKFNYLLNKLDDEYESNN